MLNSFQHPHEDNQKADPDEILKQVQDDADREPYR